MGEPRRSSAVVGRGHHRTMNKLHYCYFTPFARQPLLVANSVPSCPCCLLLAPCCLLPAACPLLLAACSLRVSCHGCLPRSVLFLFRFVLFVSRPICARLFVWISPPLLDEQVAHDVRHDTDGQQRDEDPDDRTTAARVEALWRGLGEDEVRMRWVSSEDEVRMGRGCGEDQVRLR